MAHRNWPAIVVSLLGAMLAVVARGDEPKPPQGAEASKFIRLLRDAKNRPIAMQTSSVRYAQEGANADSLRVDLIGAVHIGDTAYYTALNKQFEQYEALLYELVAPEDTRPKSGQRSGHPIGMMQTGMKDVLELDYQLDRIDYHQKNFVHADMSPAEFDKTMSERGESMLGTMFRMMGYSLAQQSAHPERSTDAELIVALFSSNRALALKRVMAQQFEDLEGTLGPLDGPEGSTIITERNKKCLEVLADQVKAGKKRIGIFYGAGHMADLEKRLLSDFGLKRGKEDWITAWDLSDKPAAASPRTKKKRKAA